MLPTVTTRIAPAIVLAVALTGCVDDDGDAEAAAEGADETVVVEGDEVEVEDTDDTTSLEQVLRLRNE